MYETPATEGEGLLLRQAHKTWATKTKKNRGARPSMASLIGNVEVLGLKGCGLLGNKGFDHQSLDGPRSVREPLPGVGVEQGSARLLQQPTESVPLVTPRRRLHQRQIRSVPFVCHRPEHLRDRRCLWDHLRPRLSPAAPVPVVTYITNHPTQFLPNSAELNRQVLNFLKTKKKGKGKKTYFGVHISVVLM